MEINGNDAGPSTSTSFAGDYGNRLKTSDVNETADIEVIFRNSDCARKYKSKIEAYLKDLLLDHETFLFNCDDSFSVDCEVITLDDTQNDSSSFCIDKASQSSTPKSSSFGPIYTSPFTGLLECKSDDTKEETKKKNPQGRTCFNCMECHHLKDCPQRHDAQRIASNRNQFYSDQPPNTCRYHEDGSLSFEGSKIRPGVISDRLREAMQLNRNQLPLYIYRMRLLGYPPGWLEDAEVESSGISLIDSEQNEDEFAMHQPHKQYDGNRFIKYPGFNCPLPNGIIDECKRLRMPAMQPHQLLSEALKHNLVTMSPPTAYCGKKKQAEAPPTKSSKKQKIDHIKVDDQARKKKERDALNSKNTADFSDTRRAGSISMQVGVPIIPTPNPFKELPCSEKFSTGITDHLNFDNLPDAVGKFDKMRSLLGKVRQKLVKED